MPAQHHHTDPDYEPPFAMFVVGSCTTCGRPVAHEPGDPGPYCINPTCPQSYEAAEARAVADGAQDEEIAA